MVFFKVRMRTVLKVNGRAKEGGLESHTDHLNSYINTADVIPYNTVRITYTVYLALQP